MEFPQYRQPEVFTEEQQRFVGQKAPTLEGYNPHEFDDDDDISQVMQPNIRKPQFLDLSDPSKLARPEVSQGGYPQPQRQQQPLYTQEPYTAGPDIQNAEAKFEKLNSIMDKVNAVAGMVDADGNSTQKFAISVAIKSLHDAIRMFEEVDYWIPQGKEMYVGKLKQIAAPIVKALKAYVSSIEKLK